MPLQETAVSYTMDGKASSRSGGTRWMLDNLRPGVRLRATGPGGTFSHVNHPSDKHLFISAGSGITPMMSMTTYMHDAGRKALAGLGFDMDRYHQERFHAPVWDTGVGPDR